MGDGNVCLERVEINEINASLNEIKIFFLCNDFRDLAVVTTRGNWGKGWGRETKENKQNFNK